MAVAAPFLLAKPDFSKTEVVKAYVHTSVAPAMDYWKETIEVKKGAQLGRMKAVRIFNPLYILGNKISVSDIDGLKIFKLRDHPEIRPQIEVMKTEVMKYQALADSIKSFVQRKDSQGEGHFRLVSFVQVKLCTSDWWKSNCAHHLQAIAEIQFLIFFSLLPFLVHKHARDPKLQLARAFLKHRRADQCVRLCVREVCLCVCVCQSICASCEGDGD